MFVQKIAHLTISAVFLFFSVSLESQSIIPLTNGSFEDLPKQSMPPRGWADCGFPGESPTDVHPHSDSISYWEVRQQAYEGNTYLGMVVRDNETYESVSQYLPAPLKKDQCYEMTIYLCKSNIYISQSRLTLKEANYNEPVVFRLYGGSSTCSREELLFETAPVANTSWEPYHLEFRPSSQYQSITLEAFYQTPVLFPYNGNLLVDHASAIKKVPCPEETAQEIVEDKNEEENEISQSPPPNTAPNSKNAQKARKELEKAEHKKEYVKPTIMPELEISNIKENQRIRIRNLQFAADSTNINEESKKVLDEIYRFMDYYPNVVIEIGGHANLKPKKSYAKDLSLERAESVSEYLKSKGIDPNRLVAVGYGNQKPIIESVNKIANKINQRVEIRILSMDGEHKKE